jgi:hypothetical protein
VHLRNAQTHYLAAEQARRNGQKLVYRDALRAAWQEEDLAEALSTGQPVRGEA